MLTQDQIRKVNEMEQVAQGVYTDTRSTQPLYDPHAIVAYCISKGIKSKDLTSEELKQFEINEKKVYVARASKTAAFKSTRKAL